MDDLFSLGQWIKRRRKACDLTQDQLAGRVGCSLETIRKIESDARRPSRQIAERLADQLGLAADERVAFLQAARAELAPDQLAPPARSVPQPALVPATALPHGTVTFLFTDVEGSTRLWAQHPQAMGAAVARHEALLRDAVASAGGVVFKTVGDAVCAAFASALDGVTAALEGQRALNAEAWDATGPLRVRMALHTGVVEERAGDYFGLPLSRVARILATGYGGQILLSHVAQELVRDQLPPGTTLSDLGLHRLKDLIQPEQIFQLAALDLPSDFPPLHTLDVLRTNLPAQPTALIGREREIADVAGLLRRADVRLLTLTGPGGTGKTRLGVQVAAELLDDFVDGVYFVDLAPISDPTLVISTIAQTLGVKETGGRPPIEDLKAYLREKRLLLLLDNFEQVLQAASVVAELLAAAPRVKVLVTSREVLHLRGEKEFPVPPLELPHLPLSPAWERGAGGEGDLSQYAAVQLFIARAQDAKRDFAVTNQNAPAVAEICARLDGLPLALELAAARIKLFDPEALLARLSNRLALLTGGARDLPARQQTIRNTIAWSYDLLRAEEQALFRRLGVFVSGCSLEAAEAVCAVDTDLTIAAVDGIASLLNQSLLRRAEGLGGDSRFVMLETIREYALERLAQSGEEATLRRRHVEYFVALAERADLELRGPKQRMWVNRLEDDHDNLRVVLAWSLRGQPEAGTTWEGALELGLRLAGALEVFWTERNHMSEAVAWIEGGLERSRDSAVPLPPSVRAKALIAAGQFAAARYDHTRATALLEESLALFRTLGDRTRMAFALVWLGRLARDQGDYGRAERLEDESLALFRSQGDAWGINLALLSLADVALDTGAPDRAKTYLQEAHAISQDLGPTHWRIWPTYNLGLMAYLQGDYAQALDRLEESLAQFRKSDNQGAVVLTLFDLGKVAHAQGDNSRAAHYFAEGLALQREALLYGDTGRDLEERGLEGLAGVAAAQEQPERAARLFGAAEALREVIGEPLAPAYRAAHERDVAAVRALLGDATFAAAWAEGRSMTLEQTIAYALEAGQ